MSNYPADEYLDEHMLALGRVAAMWSDFEFVINETIWELSNVSRKAGACLTAQMIGPGPRFRALLSLVKLHGGSADLIKDLSKHARKAEGLAAQRNRLVHDAWTVDRRGEVARIHLTADKDLQFDFVPTKIEDLKDIYNKILKHQKEFWALRDRIASELQSWPRAQYEQSDGIRSIRNAQQAM
ncbi:hypothetical protein [Rhodoplanes sp. SY1]|uniref:hypothetical protein n=1 Tax=Rhodoplanes sp. SY1 TaxID=3166646 RepID=UPI0038B5B583